MSGGGDGLGMSKTTGDIAAKVGSVKQNDAGSVKQSDSGSAKQNETAVRAVSVRMEKSRISDAL